MRVYGVTADGAHRQRGEAQLGGQTIGLNAKIQISRDCRSQLC